MEVLCNLTAEQAALYQAVVDDMLRRIEESEGIERRGLVLATMTKLKQVCNHPAHFLRDGSAAGRPVGQARAARRDPGRRCWPRARRRCCSPSTPSSASMLRGHLAGRFGREVLFLHGGVAKAARDAMVARFQCRRSARSRRCSCCR